MSGHKRASFEVAFAPDGSAVCAICGDGTVRVWNASSGTERSRFQLPANPLRMLNAALSADCRLVASGDMESDTVVIQELPGGRECRRIKVPNGKSPALALSPDGRILATAANTFSNVDKQFDPDIRLWETATGREVKVFHPAGPTALSLAFTPDGRALTSGMDDGTILHWDITGLQTGDKLRGGPEELWATLASNDAGKAHQASWALTTTPEKTIGLVRRAPFHSYCRGSGAVEPACQESGQRRFRGPTTGYGRTEKAGRSGVAAAAPIARKKADPGGPAPGDGDSQECDGICLVFP